MLLLSLTPVGAFAQPDESIPLTETTNQGTTEDAVDGTELGGEVPSGEDPADLEQPAMTDTPKAGELATAIASALSLTGSVFEISGTVTITEGGEYQLALGATVDITITTSDPVTLIGNGAVFDPNTFVISSTPNIGNITYTVGGADLTLKDIYFSQAGTTKNRINFTGEGNKLFIEGTNIIDFNQGGGGTLASIHVGQGCELTVDGGGTLYFYKSSGGAGFGGNSTEMNGTIIFGNADSGTGPTIFAKGTNQGAVIGAGSNANNPDTLPGPVYFYGGTYNFIANARGSVIGGSAGSGGGSTGTEVYFYGGNININVNYTGAAIGGGGYAEGNDASGGTAYFMGGSLRVNIDQNAFGVGAWKVDGPGVSDVAITALKLNGNGEQVYYCAFDTTLLNTAADWFNLSMDGNPDTYYTGGLHKYSFIQENLDKNEQHVITSTPSNWLPMAVQDTNLYVFLTAEDHVLTVNGEAFNAIWNEATKSFAISPVGGATPVFKLAITTPADGASFMLPTSSFLNGSAAVAKPYDWAIDWGDGSTELKAGTSADNTGIAHTYATAGNYVISLSPNGSTEAWMAAYGFSTGTTGPNTAANKNMLTGALSPLRPEMTRTDAQIAGTATLPTYEFAYWFYNCTKLTLAPTFKGWEGITAAGDWFAYFLFYGDTSLTTLPIGFNLPQDITTVGDRFSSCVFQGCNNLTALPVGFNLPQNITTVGNTFTTNMFTNCTKLSSLPDGFTFPQNVTSVGSYYAANMFQYCTSLTTLPVGFNLPQGVTSVGERFAQGLFQGCTGLSVLPVGFTLPPDITTVGNMFAMSMFAQAGSSTFQIDPQFKFPAGIPSTLNSGFNGALSLSSSAPIQNRTAASIIGDCATPNSNRSTFNDRFKDIDYIAIQWGGKGLTPPDPEPEPQYFELAITTPANGSSFILPTASYRGGAKPYDWTIDWGDGSTENKTGTSGSYGGITHTYAAAGDYIITITPHGSTEAWLAAFGFGDSVGVGSGTDANRNMLTAVLSPISPEMTRTNAQIAGTVAPPTYELAYWFYRCTKLVQAPALEGWEDITKVGDSFARNMINNCTSLTALPEGFNLPQGITTVGDSFAEGLLRDCTNLTVLPEGFNLPQGITLVGQNFAAYMFQGCTNLTALPEGFSLPQGITLVGQYFAAYMFYGCTNLTALPEGFNLPQGITLVGQYFAAYMFQGCKSISSLPDCFNLPQGIITITGDGFFAFSMFERCTSLTALPEGFNLPQGITKVGTYYFAYTMFYGCNNLTALPEGFNLPQGITTTGEQFAFQMFYGCSSLTALPDGFNLPQGFTTVGNGFAEGIFQGCSNLTALPEGFNLPQGITTVGNSFARSMFQNCTGLNALPVGFNLPQGVTTTGNSFAYNMFYGAGSATFQINDVFKFPAAVSSTTSQNFSYTFNLSSAAPAQNRTAASIIGDCATPPNQRNTFSAQFKDIDYIPVNWGGGGLTRPVGAPGSGDLDGDGEVTMAEAMIAAQVVVGGGMSLTAEEFAAIDMDGDGELTMADVIMIMRKALS